jgi:ribosome-associated protein
MSKNKSTDEASMIADMVIKGIQEKKGKEIVCLDLRKIHNAVCDFFIICHGDSTTQVEAIADSIEHETHKELQEKPWHKEGYENAEWILMDYVSVVAHVFHKDSREFYDLENLWADAKVNKIEYQI